MAAALKQRDPASRIVFVGQRGDSLSDIPSRCPDIDAVYTVRAGKLRRYSSEGLKQLFDIPTQAKNLRDMCWTVLGLGQSYRLLGRIKPDVIFTRGGFVSVPVALAGKLRGIPYVTHDSDSTPSLANRLIAKWALWHAVALPKELYPYPASKTTTVGIPMSSHYQRVTDALAKRYRCELKLPASAPIICATGGGNGAKPLNDSLLSAAPRLLARYPALVLVHIAGRLHASTVAAAYDTALDASARQRVLVLDFVEDFYRYSGAADVLIARGGATNLAEFAQQGKACLIIPSPQLGWNVKNTEALAQQQAVLALTETEAQLPKTLLDTLAALLDDDQQRRALADKLATFAYPDAADTLAQLLLEHTSSKPSGASG